MNNTYAANDDLLMLSQKKYTYYTVPTIEYPQLNACYSFIKRSLDFILSLIVSFFLIIPFFIIAICIKLDSQGPIFYKQARLGKDKKEFILYKFRSMRQDAEQNGPQWASTVDNRCTKVGAVLRKYRLDELPQIPFNILPGHMSIVGPRPERAFFYDKFSLYIKGFEQRLFVKPGLTGLAQVSGGYDLAPQEKILYDIEYIKRQSLWFDFIIILKTIMVVFNHDGAR